MTKHSLILVGFAAMSLTACGATTGGLAKSMAKQAAVNTITSNQATQTETQEVSTPDIKADAKCASIMADLEETNAVISESDEIIAGSGATTVAGQVAATGASQATLRSGAAGALAKVPFGGLFAKSAVDSMANAGRKRAEKAQKTRQKAVLRKAKLEGFYAGKNCGV